MNEIDKDELVLEALQMMKPKIKTTLNNTKSQEREDLEQEINTKIVQAVKNERIKPITFWEFKDKFDN